ncbi:MAG: hypothetical protein QW040_00210 [Candidatus Aenigmatarchaeota archaeon]
MIFGKKKDEKEEQKIFSKIEEIKLPTLEEIKSQETLKEQERKIESKPLIEEPIHPQPLPQKSEIVRKLPLFVKLENYEELITAISELKEVLSLIKTSFSLLEEGERTKIEAMGTIKENLSKVEEKISYLNSSLLASVQEEKKYQTEEIKNSLLELKAKIEKLKQEMQRI